MKYIFGLIILLTISLRLYKINAPIADWHSFRQVDTASVAREFLNNNTDIFHPKYHDLSNIQSGKDNPQGYRMVEFPLYQFISAKLTESFPIVSLEIWLRLVNIAASAGTAVLLMLLLSKYTNWLTGLLAGITYAVLPFSMFYGRAVLPDTFAVFWAMLALFLLSQKKSWIFMIAAGISAAIALLAKPTVGFLLIPSVYFFKALDKKWFFVLLYGALAILPIYIWRQWIQNFPEGIPVSEWLFNSNHIRFKGAWFHWLFAQRLGNLILGYWGLILLGLGLLAKPEKKEGSLVRWFIIGALSYVTIFATGNVQHDYYQIIIIPVVCIILAKGYYFLFTNTIFSKINSFSLMIISTLAMLSFSWFTMRTYYWINRPEIIEAGIEADRILPKDAKVIAPYNGDTTFLYQTKRSGWPIGFDIDNKIAMGATAYVTVSPTEDDWETKTLAEKYTVLVRNEKFAIIDLTKPKPQ